MCYLVWETVRQTDGQADRHAEELRAKWHCHSLWVSLPERERGGQGHTKDRQADIQTDRQADDKRQQAVERKERLNQKRQWAWVRGMNDRQWEGEKEEEGRKMCHPPPPCFVLSCAVFSWLLSSCVWLVHTVCSLSVWKLDKSISACLSYLTNLSNFILKLFYICSLQPFSSSLNFHSRWVHRSGPFTHHACESGGATQK